MICRIHVVSLACALGLLVVFPFILKPFRVTGASMTTTFSNGDVVLVDMLTPQILRPSRGGILVFKNPRGKEAMNGVELDIKRVVGLPGETVHVRRDRVVIDKACDADGTPLPPAKVEMATSDGPCQTTYPAASLIGGGTTNGNNNDFDMFLGPLDYFVMGDNRIGSIDSRRFGSVQPEHFFGSVIAKIATASTKPVTHNPSARRGPDKIHI